MTDAAAFAGTYSDLKLVKSRSVAQVIVELPIEHAERFIAAFGMPIPGLEKPVALALLNLPTAQPAVPEQREPSAGVEDGMRVRSVMLCKDKAFQAYCKADNEAEAREYLLTYCEIDSRSELAWNHAARARFETLHGRFMQSAGRMAEARG